MALRSKSTIFPEWSNKDSESDVESLDAARSIAARLNGVPSFTLVVEDFHWVSDSDVQRGLIELL